MKRKIYAIISAGLVAAGLVLSVAQSPSAPLTHTTVAISRPPGW